MRVQVRPMRKLGRNLPNKDMLAQPPVVGLLAVDEQRDFELGRSTVRARLMNDKDGTDVLPELGDALLLWAGKNRMRMAGIERINHASYAQTWSIEVA